jgi:HAD superfamily hydrolase (TIGR01509 family)
MTQWPGAILFDFDGVIVNSEPLHFLAFHDVFAEFQIELTEADYFAEYLGFDDRGAIRHAFAKNNRPLDAKTMLAAEVRKSQVMMNLIESRKIEALPGVEELVRGLWRHYPLAICSGALREEIEAMLLAVSLRDCFPVIVAAEDVAVGKPDPSGYLMAVGLLNERHQLRLKPADCLIIEDAPTVVQSMRQAGFPVLAVTTSSSAEKLADANYIVQSLHPDEVLKQVPALGFTR